MESNSPNQSLPEQSEVLKRLQDEREETFAEFFQVARDRLKRIVHFRLDYRLRGRVSESDVIQETYVRAAKRIDRYVENPEVPFFVWLRAELHQKLIEIHRNAFRRRQARRAARTIHPPRQYSTNLRCLGRSLDWENDFRQSTT